jgi:hypothetical protein
MYFQLSSMTRNRLFQKAKRGAMPELHALEATLVNVCEAQPFDGVIISLVDEPPTHYQELPNQDGIYHVEVGYDFEKKFRWDEPLPALNECLRALRLTLGRMPVSQAQRERLMAAYDTWVASRPAT